MRRHAHVVAFTIAAALGACSSTSVDRRSAVEHGRDLFGSAAASESRANKFSCATCHAAIPDAGSRIFPGASLAGAVRRPTYWGGREDDLLQAINDCRFYFMGSPSTWTPSDEAAQAMYAYLASLPEVATGPQPFTTVAVAGAVPPGDGSRGERVYDDSCRTCHGAAHTGAGRLREAIPVLPEESVRAFEGYGFDRAKVRLVFIEKVRHGVFFGLFGNMPPYSKEALSDGDLGAVLAFLALD